MIAEKSAAADTSGAWMKCAAPVRAAMLISALLVVLVRLLAPFAIRGDQAVQIEAAYRFAEGQGVTSMNQAAAHPDISVKPEAQPVTWWAPGFSVVLGSLFMAGLPLAVALKLLFGCVTLAGWFGWAVLTEVLLRPLRFGRSAWLLLSGVAASMPLVLTPAWSTSDPFLWAGVPFAILLLVRECPDDWRYDLAAGILIGILVCFRYAAAFLVPAAALMLLHNGWPDWKRMLRRGMVFGIGLMVPMLPLVWFLKSSAESHGGTVIPAVATAGGEVVRSATLFTTLGWIIGQSASVWYLLPGLAAVGAWTLRSGSDTTRHVIGGAGLLGVLLLPWVARNVLPRATAFALAVVPFSLVLFLGYVNKALFFSERRYYEPAVPAVLLLLFGIAASPLAGRAVRALAGAAAGTAALYLLYIVLYIPAAAVFEPDKMPYRATKLLGYSPRTGSGAPFPAPSIVFGPKEATRRRVAELYSSHPGTVWFVQLYKFFAYDAAVRPEVPPPGFAMRAFPSAAYWKTAFSSRPARLFFVLHGKAAVDFIPKDKQRVLYEDSREQSRIVMAEIPAGWHFSESNPRISDPENTAPIEEE